MLRLSSLGHATLTVESASTKIMVDPWLTNRLDRFWVRSPRLDEQIVQRAVAGLDCIFLTHHHCDHLHYPSLRLLSSTLLPAAGGKLAGEVEVFYPAAPSPPRWMNSGMGHLPIPLTLDWAGFTRRRGVSPHDKLTIGDITVRAFPSRVRFPEVSLLFEHEGARVLLCQDAVLHPDTWAWLSGPDAPSLGAALIPAHSIVPPNILTERTLRGTYADAKRKSMLIFDRYVSAAGAQIVLPFACGWQVDAVEPGFGWCNPTLYPWTPVEARDRIRAGGGASEIFPPGGVLTVGKSDSSLSVPDIAGAEAAYRAIELHEDVEVPPFSPAEQRAGKQTHGAGQLVARFAEEFVGTELWAAALARQSKLALDVWDDAAGYQHFVIDASGRRVHEREAEPGEATSRTAIAAATLEAMLDSRLLFGNSWGLWTSDSPLLSAVFHDPRYTLRHFTRQEGREIQECIAWE